MGIFDGLTTGLKKGLQYDVDVARLLAWATKNGNAEAIAACGAIAAQFVKEASDAKGNVKAQVIATLLGGSDPFAESRKMAQDALAKFGRH